jgi:hypothetical protein
MGSPSTPDDVHTTETPNDQDTAGLRQRMSLLGGFDHIEWGVDEEQSYGVQKRDRSEH